MGFADILIMVFIIAGSLYVLYRSMWKKQGHCPGCDVGVCDVRKKIAAAKICRER